jgi:outer membrane scaffolding protein for murein synthesis (MipA/OmpV family)
MHNVSRFSRCGGARRLALLVLAAAAGGNALADSQPPADDGSLVLGAGGAAGPRYSGSGQHSVGPLLLIDYSTGGFFASTLRGVGYGAQAGAVSYSAALGYRGERLQKNQTAAFGNGGASRLQGMGDVKGNISAVLGAGCAPLPGLGLGISVDVPLSQKDNGKALHVQMSDQLHTGGDDDLTLALATGFADSGYAQTYYGVSARQAASSRFGAYRARAGLYEVSATLTWSHQIDRRWGVTSMLGANRLLRDAARSPLTERRTAPTAALYATYNY